MKKITVLFLAVLLAFILTCSASFADDVLNFSEKSITLAVGQSAKVTPLPADESLGKAVKTVWETSDKEIATVSNGTIKASGAGEATITCTMTWKDGTEISGSIHVDTFQPVKKVMIDNQKITINVGETKTLIASVSPEDARYSTVTWSSSDESVAKVDENGVVTAVSAGKVKITATSDDVIAAKAKPQSAACNVTVNQPVTAIVFEEKEVTLDAGKKMTLKPSVEPDSATNKKLNWSSSNENVATVKAGIVTAKGVGLCTITAEATDGSGIKAECNIMVIHMISKVTFKNKIQVMLIDQALNVEPVIAPENSSNPVMTWTTSNSNVATVNEGVVTPVSAGECTISCATTDGSNLTAGYEVRVIGKTTYEMLSGCEWYYNESSDTTLNRISFDDKNVTIEQMVYDGNGRHIASKNTYLYSVKDGNIIIDTTSNQLSIPCSFDGKQMHLGNGEFLTLEDVDAGLQGFWQARFTDYVEVFHGYYTYDHNIQIKNGTLKYEHASESAVSRYEYFYYGPYTGKYTLSFGCIDTDMEYNGRWGWTIIRGVPIPMYYAHKAVPSKKLPGFNGYSF